MVAILDRPQVKPSPIMLNQLKRIGELKESLGRIEQEACAALGLQVQLTSLEPESPGAHKPGRGLKSKNSGFQHLRVVAGATVICLDAWRKASKSEEWTIMVYSPGEWEARCQPTLRLAQWLYEWDGLQPEMQLTLQMAVDNFRRTGILSIPLREERGGRLCGRCGEEVTDLNGHIRTVHDRPDAVLSLTVYVRVRGGKKSVLVTQGKGQQQHMWTIPEELHRPEFKDPRFRMSLANDIDRVFLLIGKSRGFSKNGQYLFPDDITPLPALASALRRLIKGDALTSG